MPAGTLNHDGLLVVEATKGFQDSTPARIARLTAQAQARLVFPTQHCPQPMMQSEKHDALYVTSMTDFGLGKYAFIVADKQHMMHTGAN